MRKRALQCSWRLWLPLHPTTLLPCPQTWTAVGYIILVVVVACSITLIVAGLIAPTLASYTVRGRLLGWASTAASHQCTACTVNTLLHHTPPLQAQDTLSMVLRSAGVASSRCSARLFKPGGTQGGGASPEAAKANGSSNGHNAGPAAAAETLEAEAAITVDDSVTAEQWRLRLQANSVPAPPSPSGGPGASPALRRQPVGMLNPHLAQVLNFLLASAAAEPQWVRSAGVCGGGGDMSGTWFDVSAWRQLAMLLQQLVSRCEREMWSPCKNAHGLLPAL